VGIICKNVKKSYGGVHALKDASITVNDGEVRCLFGGNGSGKSTLGKIICGAVHPDGGEITCNDEHLHLTSPFDGKARGIVLASQELSLLNYLTVEENIILASLPVDKMGFVDRKELERKADEILAEFHLQSIAKSKVADLPPNIKYLVEFGKALAQNPKVVILDEVTSAMYRADVELVRKKVEKLKEDGVCVILITHRIDELFSIGDTVTVLRNGETVHTCDVTDVTESQLIELMTGKIIENPIDVSALQSERQASDDKETLLEVKDLDLPGFHGKSDYIVKKGEIIGIAGLQGNGQSTLLRRLFGLYGPVTEKIEGKEVTVRDAASAVANGLAFCSGDREREGTYMDRSIKENLLDVLTLVKKQKCDEPDKLLDSFGVKYNGDSDQVITALSGGNQQKVVLSRWLASEPKLLLADDPSKGIDVQARYDMYVEMKRLSDAGVGVIIFSSDDDELVRLASITNNSAVWVMVDGHVIKELKGSEVTRDNIIKYSFMTGKRKEDSNENI